MTKKYDIGLDVHKDSIAIAYTHEGSRREAAFHGTCGGSNLAIERALRALAKKLNAKHPMEESCSTTLSAAPNSPPPWNLPSPNSFVVGSSTSSPKAFPECATTDFLRAPPSRPANGSAPSSDRHPNAPSHFPNSPRIAARTVVNLCACCAKSHAPEDRHDPHPPPLTSIRPTSPPRYVQRTCTRKSPQMARIPANSRKHRTSILSSPLLMPLS